MITTWKLWRVVGTSPNGNPVRMTVRATDYSEARRKASKAGAVIRELVLIEGKPDGLSINYDPSYGDPRDAAK